jgi:hypothetical protein
MTMELELPGEPFQPVEDRRPRVPEPLPVKLVAVADVRIRATTGLRLDLDRFYRDILGFAAVDDPEAWIYQADNFQLIVEGVEGLVEREDYRPVTAIVSSLAAIVDRLREREIEFEYLRGLDLGQVSVRVLDPSGNGVEVSEERRLF